MASADDIDVIVDRNVALAQDLGAEERSRLLDLTDELIGSKRWEPVAGFTLTDEVLVTLAANAAIPILNLDSAMYSGVKAIIVQPRAHMSTGTRSGPTGGLVSDESIAVVGLATANSGPMSLSWSAALHESRRPETGRNVVIHEFAHKIDSRDGGTDGTPPLRGPALERWAEMLDDEYGHMDPRASDEVLRTYAWTNPAEFFAVATETFFCTPLPLRAAKPVLYGALSDFFHQDPASRQTVAVGDS